MRKKEHLPSSYYPDYFKMDLNLGGESAHPFAQAIDTCLEDITTLSCEISHRIQPTFYGPEEQATVLKHLSFTFDTLNQVELDQLFHNSAEMLHARGTLMAIQLLADVYFEEAQARRGLPFPKMRLSTPSRSALPLSDGASSEKVIFVRLKKKTCDERVREFIRNCQTLIPQNFSVRVAQPHNNVTHEVTGFDLHHVIPLKSRRL